MSGVKAEDRAGPAVDGNGFLVIEEMDVARADSERERLKEIIQSRGISQTDLAHFEVQMMLGKVGTAPLSDRRAIGQSGFGRARNGGLNLLLVPRAKLVIDLFVKVESVGGIEPYLAGRAGTD